jgi:ADP-ribose pyrophosphatase YjhB (NUDIX family)
MDDKGLQKFNIRIYGLFINEHQEILLADEERFGMRMTKFPGGGLQLGEGPVDCLKREAIEEFGQKIEVLEHFYTTDYFQKAAFYDDQQLISIYYRARFIGPIQFKLSEKPFDFKLDMDEIISFRYVKLTELDASQITFPIDKYVLGLLKNRLISESY